MILFFISFCKQTNLKITVKHSSSKEIRFTVKRICSITLNFLPGCFYEFYPKRKPIIQYHMLTYYNNSMYLMF